MFQDAFYKIESPESDAVLQTANPLFQDAAFNPKAATLLACDLPFYPGHRFIDIACYESVPASRRHVVQGPGGSMTVLNWTNEPIYRLNKSAPITLTSGNVGEYVRFFFGSVRGRHGRFQIAETAGDIPWQEDPPPSARKAVGRMIQPVQMIGAGREGIYSMFACMVFRGSLYRATVKVDRAGLVSVGDEELLVENMPVRDDVLG